jgi:hypothetical protein
VPTDQEPGRGAEEPDQEPVPDRVPDELLERYGSQARKAVRHSRSRVRPVARRMRIGLTGLRGGDVWLFTLMIFGWGVIGLAIVGALAYSVILWPGAGMFVVVPVATLFILSLLVGARMAKKRRQVEQEDESLLF